MESLNPLDEPAGKNPFEEEETNEVIETIEPSNVSPFHGLISGCFENHLNIYVDSQDKYSFDSEKERIHSNLLNFFFRTEI